MNSMAVERKILLAEDDIDIARIVVAYLEREGFGVLHATDGYAAMKIAEHNHPDFVILDIKMPKKDGWQVLAELRRFTDVPIMMLTAIDTDIDKVFALKTGADDYLVKPFNPAELMARIHVILKRSHYHQHNESMTTFKSKNMEVNKITHQVLVGSGRVDISAELTSTEFKILSHLIRHPKRVFTREELINACLPEGNASERTVDSHVSKLRKKIQQAGVYFVPESVRGFGYRLGD
ncbi:response regulator [Enterobacter sp. 04-C-01-SI_S15]|nr:response regulator transcription factor [Citrobacter freundii]HBM9967986.1 response regulator transcription factor [Enterobacter chengduensis]EKW7471306.1 response regulator transcription factor [Citrobacter freundii]HBH6881773.1 response regulator transcription factor [Citrobacter freundii]HBH6984906.1 response regulator transcription factor [Citrobacter freundii]